MMVGSERDLFSEVTVCGDINLAARELGTTDTITATKSKKVISKAI
jgi:hypothetical protein